MRILQGYNLYHKSIILGFWFIVFVMLLRAGLMMVGGQFEIKTERIIQASPAAIWPWVTENKNRARWQAHVTDIILMNGDVEQENSVRMLFWKENGKRWSAREATRTALRPEFFSTLQESEKSTRILTIDLTAIAACETRVVISEIIEPKLFSGRFLFIPRFLPVFLNVNCEH